MDGNGWKISCVDYILQESRNLQNLRNKIIVKINSLPKHLINTLACNVNQIEKAKGL